MTNVRYVNPKSLSAPPGYLLVILRLAREGWLFEIDAVAVLPEK